eukprot:g11781.t1
MDGRVIKTNEINPSQRFSTTSTSSYNQSLASTRSNNNAIQNQSNNAFVALDSCRKTNARDGEIDSINLKQRTFDYGYGKGPEQFTCGKQYDQEKFYLGGMYSPASFTYRNPSTREGSGYTPARYSPHVQKRVWKQNMTTGDLVKKNIPTQEDLGVGDINGERFYTLNTTSRYMPTPPWEKKQKRLQQSNIEYHNMIATGSPRSRRHLITSVKTTDVVDKQLRQRPYKKVPPFVPKQWPFDHLQRKDESDIHAINTKTRNMNTASRPQSREPKYAVVHDGSIPRDPSRQFLATVIGKETPSENETLLSAKIGKFEHVSDEGARRSLQLWERNRVMLQDFLINYGAIRYIKYIEPKIYKGKHVGNIVDMISEREDFDEYFDWINNEISIIMASGANIDITNVGMNEIEDPSERERVLTIENKYINALSFVNRHRQIMWKYDPKYRKMSQKDILEDIVNSKNFLKRMSEFEKKARNLQTTSSQQVQTVMGGSKDFMPVKEEVRSRQEESMNKACMDWAYDKIVDHESAFLKKHQGYSNMTGWAHQLKKQTMAFEALDKMMQKKNLF